MGAQRVLLDKNLLSFFISLYVGGLEPAAGQASYEQQGQR